MSDIELLKNLACESRGEDHPRVDVADAVLRRIRTERRTLPDVSLRPLMWVAFSASAVLAALTPVAVIAWDTWLFPLMAAIEPGAWGM